MPVAKPTHGGFPAASGTAQSPVYPASAGAVVVPHQNSRHAAHAAVVVVPLPTPAEKTSYTYRGMNKTNTGMVSITVTKRNGHYYRKEDGGAETLIADDVKGARMFARGKAWEAEQTTLQR